MFSNKSRAFYNSAFLMNLSIINVEDSIKYLQKRFSKDKITISVDVCKYIIDKVNSIPYYIQFIAAEIWQQVINSKKKILPEHVDEAVNSVLELKSDYYWELLSKQTNYRKKVLYILSKSPKKIFSKETALKYDLGASSSTQKAIKSFIEEGIIEHFNDRYEFSDPFFKMFLLNKL